MVYVPLMEKMTALFIVMPRRFKVRHNREIPLDIRQQNDAYNSEWVSKCRLIGANYVPSEELDVNATQALDANLTCPGIFRPSEIRDNGSLTARSSDEESTIYGRTDRSHIARS